MAEAAVTRAPAKSTSAAITIAICFAVAVLEGYDIQAMGVAARIPMARRGTVEIRPVIEIDGLPDM